MNPRFFKLLLSSAVLGLSSYVAGCAADTDSDSAQNGDEEVAVDSSEISGSAASNFGYFIVTGRDLRKCAAPLCGGFFVKRVNEAKTRCADGTLQEQCYVSSIELNGIGLSQRELEQVRPALESGKALVKARTYKKTFAGHAVGVLKSNEAWIGATGSSPDGTFYRTADNGIRCITAPCPSTSAFKLNANDEHHLIDVTLDQTEAPVDQAKHERAQNAIGTSDGVIIAGGVQLPKCKPTATDCGPRAVATEFYLRVTRREGKSCGGHTMFWQDTLCNDGQFCNYAPSDICGAADAPGTCAYRPEMCITLFKPVCGCDGKTYGNDCSAASAGMSVARQGACEAPESTR